MDLRERVSLALLCVGVIFVTTGAALISLEAALLAAGAMALLLGVAVGFRTPPPPPPYGGER